MTMRTTPLQPTSSHQIHRASTPSIENPFWKRSRKPAGTKRVPRLLKQHSPMLTLRPSIFPCTSTIHKQQKFKRKGATVSGVSDLQIMGIAKQGIKRTPPTPRHIVESRDVFVIH